MDNADGESLYTLEPKALKPGEKQKVSISYSTVPPVEPAPGSELNGVLIGLGVALVVAVVAMVVVVRRRSATARIRRGARATRSPIRSDGARRTTTGPDEDDRTVHVRRRARPDSGIIVGQHL